MTEEQKTQLIAQCNVIAHLASAISITHAQLAQVYAGSSCEETPDLIGRLTADRMEAIGNILNGMDAVTKDDDWVFPIFDKAHKMWSQP